MRAVKITSITDLIAKLGGPKATGEVLGTTPQNVVNWRKAGKMPARLHRVHQQKLAAHGLRLDDDCWSFKVSA